MPKQDKQNAVVNFPKKYDHPIFVITMFQRENNLNQIWLRLDGDDGTQHTPAENPFQLQEPTQDYLIGRPFKNNEVNHYKSKGRIFADEFEGKSMENEDLEQKVLELAQPKETLIENDQIVKVKMAKQFIMSNVKVQFNLTAADEKQVLTFTFNQDYGIMISASDKQTFLDMNIFNSQKQTELFIITFENQLYISVQGITFNDIIYAQNLTDKSAPYKINFLAKYQEGISKLKVSQFSL